MRMVGHTTEGEEADMAIDKTLTQQPRYVAGHGVLEDRTVVVTAGAGGGIGRSAALRCLEEGARAVIIGDVSDKRLKGVQEEFSATFGEDRVATAFCDASDESQVQSLFDLADAYGGMDVLMNNAAVANTVAIQEMSDDDWSRVINVTLTSVFRCTRGAARRWIDRGVGGIVINNASIVGWTPVFGMAHYAAAKGGVMALTRASAVDLAPHGIRVNAVAPSLAMNPFLVKVTNQDHLDEMTRREPFGRAAEPWEVANAMVFLASDYSQYMTGEILSVSCQHA
jgi:3-oxoacyl-[acyl-carrier protein] reductase